MPRTIVIGDVHGCRDEHARLLSEVGVTKDDMLVYLGDLLDKGPDGPGLIRDIRARSDGV